MAEEEEPGGASRRLSLQSLTVVSCQVEVRTPLPSSLLPTASAACVQVVVVVVVALARTRKHFMLLLLDQDAVTLSTEGSSLLSLMPVKKIKA